VTQPDPTPAALPTVSVVIPCFNHGKFVAEAVRSCLQQHDADVRVIIVNDGSTDGTTPAACDACVALDPARVRVLHQVNKGLPAARNAGAALARQTGFGEYLVFLDADDWIRPTFVSRLNAELRRDADPAVSHAYCQEELVELGHGIWTVPAWDPELLLVTNLHPVTCLIRRACFEAVGGFDESMTQGYEDWELWVRFASRGWRGVRVREPLFVWRRHSQITMVMEAVTRHETLFRQILERHRELYARHAEGVMVRSNVLLRKADANWLDEEHRAIFIRDLRAWNQDLVRERDASREESSRVSGELAVARAQVAALRAERDRLDSAYRRSFRGRAGRAARSVLGVLPGPIARPLGAFFDRARGAR
jgi:glycosyltransferase involved in cell wall biosynthesis